MRELKGRRDRRGLDAQATGYLGGRHFGITEAQRLRVGTRERCQRGFAVHLRKLGPTEPTFIGRRYGGRQSTLRRRQEDLGEVLALVDGELRVGVRQVRLDGAHRHDEAFRDLAVAEPARSQLRDVSFPAGE